IFSGLLLFLTALLLWHKGLGLDNFSPLSFWPKPVARVNGDPILQSELKERMTSLKEFMEGQYGKEVFKGEKGQVLWANLEKKVLAELIEEKIIAQEAQKLGIQINEADVQREIEEIARKVFGSPAKFAAELEGNKKFKNNLENYIRHLLTINAVSLAKANPNSPSPDNFISWLEEAKKKARIEIYGFKNSLLNIASQGCCASGGCGFRQSRGDKIDPHLEEKASLAALKAYKKKNPDAQNLTAKVKDYGCHIQVDIEKDGLVVKSYVYQNGEVEEL
ncbi:MAG: SurA N-terminal domain-containing protein, partial [bacterium]